MRKLHSVLAGWVVAGLLASQPVWAHVGIELRTYPEEQAAGMPIRQTLDPGQTLSANGDPAGLVSGAPLSARQSCDGCHDYEVITAAYHFQLGADERVDLDGDGFADELGQVLTGHGGVLETLPTLYNVSSPGQFGAW